MRYFSAFVLIGMRFGWAFALAAIALAAQEPAPPPANASQQQGNASPQQVQQPPRFRTEANYVRVDVYPSQDGRLLTGLRIEDFELLENGVPQAISAFEHVVITAAGPQALRRDPGSVREAEQQAADARSRVFIVFLDVPHVAVEGGAHIREPLIRLMDRVMGEDDLIAFMTPEMSPNQITFGRKTDVVAAMLREGWTWGHRHSIRDMDQMERNYQRCFPDPQGARVSDVAAQMIARRRERMVLESLHELVQHLGGIREERKAIIAVTEGWVLYRPDTSLTTPRADPSTGQRERVPGKPPIGVDEHGTLRIDPPSRGMRGASPSLTECDRDRMFLASIDNDDYFRFLLDAANRHNASFYPIDPRGLAVFDYPLGPGAPPPITLDQASLRQRNTVLRTLAENTDGLAVVDSNDLEAGLQRIADDLTSYYLLGYYSTNTKLDGAYRRITVRVKQPGVQVRARRGYRAATEADVKASLTAAAAPVPDHVKTTTAALAGLSRLRDEQRFSVHAVPVHGTAGTESLWVVGELLGPLQEFSTGGSVAVEVTGDAATAATGTIEPGQRTFVLKLPIGAGGGAADVRVRVTPARGGDGPLSEMARVDLSLSAVRPLLFRRGPATGNRLQPAADMRFSRTERLRLELPLPPGAAPGEGRVLDRTGQPLQVPVQVGERTDDDGQRWMTADATLAALGAGDYVLEIAYRAAGAEQRVLTGIRVTR